MQQAIILPFVSQKTESTIESRLYNVAARLNEASAHMVIAAKCASRCDFDSSFRDRIVRQLETLITELKTDATDLIKKDKAVAEVQINEYESEYLFNFPDNFPECCMYVRMNSDASHLTNIGIFANYFLLLADLPAKDGDLVVLRTKDDEWFSGYLTQYAGIVGLDSTFDNEPVAFSKEEVKVFQVVGYSDLSVNESGAYIVKPI